MEAHGQETGRRGQGERCGARERHAIRAPADCHHGNGQGPEDPEALGGLLDHVQRRTLRCVSVHCDHLHW